MKNKIFAYSILAVNVVTAWIAFGILGQVLRGNILKYNWILPIAAFGVWAVFFSLSTIFIRSRWWQYGAWALALLGYIFLVDFGWSSFVLILAFLLFLLTEHTVKNELAGGIRIHFYRVVNVSLKYFVTAVCIVVAVAYYFSLERRENLTIPNIETKTLEEEIKWGLKLAGVFMPEKEKLIEDIEKDMTVDEYLLKNQLMGGEDADGQMLQNGIADLPPDVSVSAIGEVINGQFQQEMLKVSKGKISEQLGVAVQGDEKVKDILVKFIETKQNEFLADAFSKGFYLSLIMALGLFLAIRLIGAGVDIILGFLILGIIKLFVRSGAVEMRKEMREVGVIDYSI